MKISIKIKWFLIMVGLCVSASPLTMAQRAEFATAIARGPLNMASLYAEARHKPSAKALKIAAQLARITNDLLSIVTRKNSCGVDYFYTHQFARIVHASIALKNALQSSEVEFDIPWWQEVIADWLFTIETVAAFLSLEARGEVWDHDIFLDTVSRYNSSQRFISCTQGCADFMRDQTLSMKAIDAGLIGAAFGISVGLYQSIKAEGDVRWKAYDNARWEAAEADYNQQREAYEAEIRAKEELSRKQQEDSTLDDEL